MPTVAAFGLVVSGGTSIRRSAAATALQASRQPSLSSSGEKARASTSDGGTSPPVTRTLHFLQVPWPPQVESIAMPFQLAASKMVTPDGVLTLVCAGTNSTSTRCAMPGPASADSAASRPDPAARGVVMSLPVPALPGPALPGLALPGLALPGLGAPRSSARPTRLGRAAGQRPAPRARAL